MDVASIKPEELYLDTQNPRFGLSEAVNEAEALAILVETADLRELWNSISERGFEKFEPLVAMKENDKFIVLEGNRRLAAVKLLLDPTILSKDSIRRKVPELPPDKLDTCRELPVVVVKDRAAAAGYIGFKHVNGPARWSSLAKARFGVRFFEALDGLQSPQQRMQSLTKQLGDSRGVIIRLLVAFKIVQQSVDLGSFEKLGIDQGEIEFSHLYTLINNPDSREFIGLPRAPLSESLIINNPIPPSHYGPLFEVLGWLYGERSVIKSQGTDRPRLQRVLASTDGIQELRLTGDLSAAETVAGLRNEDWLGSIAKISTLMQKASTDAAIVIDDLGVEELAQARSLLKRVNSQLRQIQAVLPDEAD